MVTTMSCLVLWPTDFSIAFQGAQLAFLQKRKPTTNFWHQRQPRIAFLKDVTKQQQQQQRASPTTLFDTESMPNELLEKKLKDKLRPLVATRHYDDNEKQNEDEEEEEDDVPIVLSSSSSSSSTTTKILEGDSVALKSKISSLSSSTENRDESNVHRNDSMPIRISSQTKTPKATTTKSDLLQDVSASQLDLTSSISKQQNITQSTNDKQQHELTETMTNVTSTENKDNNATNYKLFQKGGTVSDEIRAKISKTIRDRHKQRRAEKIAQLGLTEEEYIDQRKKEDRNRRRRQRAARARNETLASPNVALPTAKGGYTHTLSSRAKISAANRGKVPWNKGKARSEEVRAKIAASVNRRNREKFLQKIAALNMTEAEYKEHQKEERRKREAKRKAKRTPRGGNVLSEETKQKISKVISERWASGQMKKRTTNSTKPVKTRGPPSLETRRRISESLKRRWATDEEYRNRMLANIRDVNGGDKRMSVSEKLRQRWQNDEAFRERMLKSIRNRKSPSRNRSQETNRKISDAMKRRWSDQSYREKMSRAIRDRAIEHGSRYYIKPRSSGPRAPQFLRVPRLQGRRSRGRRIKKKTGKDGDDDEFKYIDGEMKRNKQYDTSGLTVVLFDPDKDEQPFLTERKKRMPVAAQQYVLTKLSKKNNMMDKFHSIMIRSVNETSVEIGNVSYPIGKLKLRDRISVEKYRRHGGKKMKEPLGSIRRLKEERRDLYDLLYGDDEFTTTTTKPSSSSSSESSLSEKDGATLSALDSLLEDDFDFEQFDPYGLD